MIEFNFETNVVLKNESNIKYWISNIIAAEGFELGEIIYIFCDDDFLHKLNMEYLKHDTLTDIISFDYRMGEQLNGEIYISVERVLENAQDFNTEFETELHRVIIHGILHFCGYMDKSEEDQRLMRSKENDALQLYKNFKL